MGHKKRYDNIMKCAQFIRTNKRTRTERGIPAIGDRSPIAISITDIKGTPNIDWSIDRYYMKYRSKIKWYHWYHHIICNAMQCTSHMGVHHRSIDGDLIRCKCNDDEWSGAVRCGGMRCHNDPWVDWWLMVVTSIDDIIWYDNVPMVWKWYSNQNQNQKEREKQTNKLIK